jgi:hypothetical protein
MDTLPTRAQQTLLNNRRDGFTVPTQRLYPFQWNWDSGFTCLGYSHFALSLAIAELRSLFSGQWANGMLPHILFHSENEASYFPNHDFWQPEVNPGAPRKPRTSGISQPPVHAFILERLWQQHPDHADLRALIDELWPKLLALHRFYYTQRDPAQEGLVCIIHPWESGRDNSPLWDDPLDRITIAPGSLPPYQRRDTSLVDAAERPTQHHYDRYVYLLELAKRHRYEGRALLDECPFLIQDPMFNAILMRSNLALIRLGEALNFDREELTTVEAWRTRSRKSFERKLWHEKLGTYVCYDLQAEAQLPALEIGGLCALLGQSPSPDRAQRIVACLDDLRERGYWLCPSFDVDHPRFDPKRYWRGPVWPQMNWMLAAGLRAYGYHDLAHTVGEDLIRLVSKLGFFEYFDPRQQMLTQAEQGYGGNHFSWTAACVLDLWYEQGANEPTA